ncbi:hypothetical protein OROHE_019203 [Orobanche hederae]
MSSLFLKKLNQGIIGVAQRKQGGRTCRWIRCGAGIRGLVDGGKESSSGSLYQNFRTDYQDGIVLLLAHVEEKHSAFVTGQLEYRFVRTCDIIIEYGIGIWMILVLRLLLSIRGSEIMDGSGRDEARFRAILAMAYT